MVKRARLPQHLAIFVAAPFICNVVPSCVTATATMGLLGRQEQEENWCTCASARCKPFRPVWSCGSTSAFGSNCDKTPDDYTRVCNHIAPFKLSQCDCDTMAKSVREGWKRKLNLGWHVQTCTCMSKDDILATGCFVQVHYYLEGETSTFSQTPWRKSIC